MLRMSDDMVEQATTSELAWTLVQQFRRSHVAQGMQRIHIHVLRCCNCSFTGLGLGDGSADHIKGDGFQLTLCTPQSCIASFAKSTVSMAMPIVDVSEVQ